MDLLDCLPDIDVNLSGIVYLEKEDIYRRHAFTSALTLTVTAVVQQI